MLWKSYFRVTLTMNHLALHSSIYSHYSNTSVKFGRTGSFVYLEKDTVSRNFGDGLYPWMHCISICSFLPPANEVWDKVIFSVVCVKNSVQRGGSTWAGTPPRQVHPPGTGTLPGRYTPQAGTPPSRYTPWDRLAPPRSSACWEIQVTSRQFASYWNAFLLHISISWQQRISWVTATLCLFLQSVNL